MQASRNRHLTCFHEELSALMRWRESQGARLRLLLLNTEFQPGV